MAESTNKVASATEDQKSTGPASEAGTRTATKDGSGSNASGTKMYYLREGKKHSAIIKGEAIVLDRVGSDVELTDSQYSAFGDKFYTAAEYKAYQASKEELASGANAAEYEMDAESETPEEHNATGNDAAKGKDSANASGEKSVTPKK